MALLIISNVHQEIYCFCIISSISSQITIGEFYTGNKLEGFFFTCTIVRF